MFIVYRLKLYLIQDDRVGDLAVEPLSDGDVTLGRVEGGGRGRADDLGSEGAQDVDLLGAHLLRQDDDATVPLHGGCQGQANA